MDEVHAMSELPLVRVNRLMLPDLSERQWQILVLRVSGARCKEMANSLGISAKTVDVHQCALYKKLGVHSVAQLVHLCYSAGAIKTLGETVNSRA